MIASLTGQVTRIKDRYIILNVSGVGYKVHASPETIAKIAAKQHETTELHTYQAVREDSLDLYGFLEEEDLSLFELLIGVSGIGPKSAMTILGIASSETLKQTIASGDTAYLTKVSGIGRKTAEKIVLELKDKMGTLEHTGPDLKGESDALEALRSLGYSLPEARDALKQLPNDIIGTSERVKYALKHLGK